MNFREIHFVRRGLQIVEKVFKFQEKKRRKILARMDELIAQRPIHLNLECNTACNSKCVFCAYPKVKRPYSNLTMELFRKICEDFARIGGGLLGLSALISDPLLDPHILERIRHLKENHPNIVPHVYTNGIRLTFFSDEDLAFMLENLEIINLSIGGLNREDYREMFAVDMFERVWESLVRLARIRRERQLPCRLAVHIRTHKKKGVLQDPRLGQLKEMGYVCEDVLDTFSDWGGIVKNEHLPAGASLKVIDNSQATIPCLIPMTYLSVLPDGQCNVCGCMDTTNDFVVGDLNQQTIMEVWQSPIYQKFRASFQPGKVHRLCQHCSYYSPYSRALSQPGFNNYQPWQSIWDVIYPRKKNAA